MKKEVIEKISALMTAAFGLIAALAWNAAISSLFAPGGPLAFIAEGGVWVYAIVVTVIAIVMTVWIGKLAQKVQ